VNPALKHPPPLDDGRHVQQFTEDLARVLSVTPLLVTMPAKYHILLFGGTGICGRIFTQAALDAGHTLTLYVRNPSKIPAEFAANPNLHTIQGELGDEEGLKKVAACRAEIFVSLAGPTLGKREGTVSHPSFWDTTNAN
jgi:nucleoside-diphosphate-sugar epimerase